MAGGGGAAARRGGPNRATGHRVAAERGLEQGDGGDGHPRPFYNAGTFLASVKPEHAQVAGATSTLSLADFVFALDPLVVQSATPDTIRDVMEPYSVEQVFLVDELRCRSTSFAYITATRLEVQPLS